MAVITVVLLEELGAGIVVIIKELEEVMVVTTDSITELPVDLVEVHSADQAACTNQKP